MVVSQSTHLTHSDSLLLYTILNPGAHIHLQDLDKHALSQHHTKQALSYSSLAGYFSSPADSKSSPTENDTACVPLHANSTSDEDQQIIQSRKQQRMLSNRESARRSRLRKQQHLDELRAHATHLRAQNSQILSSFSVASKRYAQITEENRVLHSEALTLTIELQRLHSLLTSNIHFDEVKSCVVRPSAQAALHSSQIKHLALLL